MTIFTKLKLSIIGMQALKWAINVAAVHLYRRGDEGYFVGATFNRNHDIEFLTSGVYMTFLLFSLSQLISHLFVYLWDRDNINKPHIIEVILNVLGMWLWICTGATVINFWSGYLPSDHTGIGNPRSTGITMGVLTVINGAVYGIELALSHFNQKHNHGREEPTNRGGVVYRSTTTTDPAEKERMNSQLY